MHLRLSHPDKVIRGTLRLPASKSVSNRLLIMNALATEPAALEYLSDSEDTRVLQQALRLTGGTIDIGHAGTAMRFLTAYLSRGSGNYLLTGSSRMQERPIAKLVNALRMLGADIRYAGKEGFPPLQIHGRPLTGGKVEIDSSISSQYISALMMIAPVLDEGLIIQLDKEPVSTSYLRMTGALMKDWGIDVAFGPGTIRIAPGAYKSLATKVEGDWSAAGYWYAIAGLASEADLVLEGLRLNSTQGDAVLMDLFRPLGVETRALNHGLQLRKISATTSRFHHDFSDSPDLVQTLCVYCSLKGIPFEMAGTQTLRIKETDRIAALQAELRQIGVDLKANESGSRIWWDGSRPASNTLSPCIRTYQDHRMAMAFSCTALIHSTVIEDAEVVRKSYPRFWQDLKRVGFVVEEFPA